MNSFYDKLSMKLQGEGAASPKEVTATPAKSVSYSAAGTKVPTLSPVKASDPPADASSPVASTPDGMDPLMVDLFQSEGRMIIFVQAGGILPEDFDVTADEESNTLVIQASQKRPAAPPLKSGEVEKGRFVKQEIKWGALYRKVYLPEPFDSSEAQTFLEHGVLVVVLPVKKPGEGKKLPVRELKNSEETKK